MDQTEETRAVCLKWWECMVGGDVAGMEALCADDFQSWSPSRGWIDKEATQQFTTWFRTLLVDGWFSFDDPIITVEGDRACVATGSHAPLKNGNTYSNSYHFLHQIRDGKLIKTWEYNDSLHVWGVLETELTAKRAEAAAQQ